MDKQTLSVVVVRIRLIAVNRQHRKKRYQLKALTAECIVFLSLLCLRAFSEELRSRTGDIVYSSRRGRDIAIDKIIADGVKELRSEWGSRFDENKATALKAFTALDKRMGGRLATSIEGRDMANNPVFVRAFHEIGKLLSEDVLSGGSGTAPSDARESAVDTYKGMFKE